MKIVPVLLLGLIMVSCALNNPYFDYYQGTSPSEIAQNQNSSNQNPKPQAFKGSDPNKETTEMLENGYGLIGVSAFEGGDVSDYNAYEMAVKLHASKYILYKQYVRTDSGTKTLYLPGSKTTTGYGNYGGIFGTWSETTSETKRYDIAYSHDRYNYLATYWTVSKPPRLGVYFEDLSDEQRIFIGSNRGVHITLIIKNSPAYYNDILKGDIIKRINDDDVYDSQSMYKLLDKYSGQTVCIELIRNKEKIVKSFKLN